MSDDTGELPDLRKRQYAARILGEYAAAQCDEFPEQAPGLHALDEVAEWLATASPAVIVAASSGDVNRDRLVEMYWRMNNLANSSVNEAELRGLLGGFVHEFRGILEGDDD